MTKRRLILIGNDDGYAAKGLQMLVDMVRDMADVLVCAPDGARSGYSRAFTADAPLRMRLRRKEDGVQVWSADGTPVDCVKLALHELCIERKPDLVLGGINHGDNASVNTHYSGTMGVAMEGCMKGIPSVALSLCSHDEDADFSPLVPYVRDIVARVLDEGLPEGVCLNVNFPVAETFKGVRVCRMAHGSWINECSKMMHPRGYEYYWMVGSYRNDEPEADDTDNYALQHGYVAITPTRVDVTDYDSLQRLKQWER